MLAEWLGLHHGRLLKPGGAGGAVNRCGSNSLWTHQCGPIIGPRQILIGLALLVLWVLLLAVINRVTKLAADEKKAEQDARASAYVSTLLTGSKGAAAARAAMVQRALPEAVAAYEAAQTAAALAGLAPPREAQLVRVTEDDAEERMIKARVMRSSKSAKKIVISEEGGPSLAGVPSRRLPAPSLLDSRVEWTIDRWMTSCRRCFFRRRRSQNAQPEASDYDYSLALSLLLSAAAPFQLGLMLPSLWLYVSTTTSEGRAYVDEAGDGGAGANGGGWWEALVGDGSVYSHLHTPLVVQVGSLAVLNGASLLASGLGIALTSACSVRHTTLMQLLCVLGAAGAALFAAVPALTSGGDDGDGGDADGPDGTAFKLLAMVLMGSAAALPAVASGYAAATLAARQAAATAGVAVEGEDEAALRAALDERRGAQDIARNTASVIGPIVAIQLATLDVSPTTSTFTGTTRGDNSDALSSFVSTALTFATDQRETPALLLALVYILLWLVTASSLLEPPPAPPLPPLTPKPSESRHRICSWGVASLLLDILLTLATGIAMHSLLCAAGLQTFVLACRASLAPSTATS